MEPLRHPDLSDRQVQRTQSGGVIERPDRMLLRWDFQRLSMNGSSACVNILRPYLRHLRWLPGQTVIVELYDDETIRVRKPTPEDVGAQIGKARRGDFPLPVKA